MENKMLKKLKKYIKKEWKIKYIDIKLEDTIISLAERITMKSENCNLQDAYKKWILEPRFHLPGWIAFFIVSEFNDPNKINQENTIKELFRRKNNEF